MSIEINNESGIEVDEGSLLRLASYALGAMHVNPEAELGIQLIDVAAMELLHVEWMDEPGPTDVLSFPMDELRPGTPDRPSPPGILGDVVLCPEVAAAQAADNNHSTMDELFTLTAHGILHLLGFDHAEPDEEREMFELQKNIVLGFMLSEKARNRE